MTKLRVIYEDKLIGGVAYLCPSDKYVKRCMEGDVPPLSHVFSMRKKEAEFAKRNNNNNEGFTHSEEDLEIERNGSKLPPMTEIEAIWYIIMKDVPQEIWATGGNRRRFKIVTEDQIHLHNFNFNQAWELSQ